MSRRMKAISPVTRVLALGLRWVRSHIGLCIVLVAFLAVARMYALRTPFFEVTDELWHFRRVQMTLDRELPAGLAFVSEAAIAPQADRQPPLYYGLGALLVAAIDVESDLAAYRLNEYAVPGEPGAIGNRNALIAMAPARADGPLARAVLRLRLFSVLCGASALVLAYLSFMRLTHRNVVTALAALVALAFMPGFMVMSSGISNMAAGFVLLMASGYLALRIADDPQPSPRLRWAAALVTLLAALTSWWGWGALLLVAYVQVQTALRLGQGPLASDRVLARQLAAMAAPALGWLAWLLTQRAGDGAPIVSSGTDGLSRASLGQIAWQAYRGLFGWLNVPAEPFYYATISVLLVLGLSGLVLWAIRIRWRRPREPWSARVPLTHSRFSVAALWAGMGVLLVLVSILVPVAVPTGAMLLPLAPAITLVMVLGLKTWVGRRFAPVLLGILVLAFGVVSFSAPLAYIEPAYAAPPRLDLDDLPYDLAPLDVTMGPELFLLGYRVEKPQVEPGGVLEIELYWLARRQTTTDYVAHLTVLGYERALVGSHMSYVGGGVHPTSLWKPGDVVVDRIQVRIADDAEAPTAADVRVSVYADQSQEPIRGVDPHGNECSGNPSITRVSLTPRTRVRFVPEYPMDANLDNEISLVGYGLSPRLPVEGEDWKIVLYWRSEGPLFRDYTVFVHLVDSLGELVAQVDGPPLQGNYPTTFWTTGEHLRDVHYLTIPDHLPSDEYRLRVGLYGLETGERLVLLDSEPPLSYVAIGPINVP
jgi:hypothetical protein